MSEKYLEKEVQKNGAKFIEIKKSDFLTKIDSRKRNGINKFSEKREGIGYGGEGKSGMISYMYWGLVR